SHHGAHLDWNLRSTREMANVVVKTVFLVPKSDVLASDVVHRIRDVNEMLEEFAGEVFVGGVVVSQLHGHGHHVQAEQSHPAGSVGLVDVAAAGQRHGAVEDTNVVKAKKAAFKNVHAERVFAIHPPGEIEKELLKHALEKRAVQFPANAPFNFINAPRRPRMHGRIRI